MCFKFTRSFSRVVSNSEFWQLQHGLYKMKVSNMKGNRTPWMGMVINALQCLGPFKGSEGFLIFQAGWCQKLCGASASPFSHNWSHMRLAGSGQRRCIFRRLATDFKHRPAARLSSCRPRARPKMSQVSAWSASTPATTPVQCGLCLIDAEHHRTKIHLGRVST